MRCDGKPVRLGMRTTRPMSRASQPDKQNGTLSVHTIKASGHAHPSNRPNTRLHPTTTPNHQINPCNAGAIHTGHSGRQLRASVFRYALIKQACPAVSVTRRDALYIPQAGSCEAARAYATDIRCTVTYCESKYLRARMSARVSVFAHSREMRHDNATKLTMACKMPKDRLSGGIHQHAGR
jgi:hypothetical protein